MGGWIAAFTGCEGKMDWVMSGWIAAFTGYEGKNCEVDVDDCASSPCNAAGTERCEDGVDSFTCHCLHLWQGRWLLLST